jgi:hypothetical protein
LNYFTKIQIERTAFVSKIIQTKKLTSKVEPEKNSHFEAKKVANFQNDQKKIQFKPKLGASPVALGPPVSRVSCIIDKEDTIS